jgi:hypothetical protein
LAESSRAPQWSWCITAAAIGGREYVTPTQYLPHEIDPDIGYVFATKGGVPTNPDWYYNFDRRG